MKKWEIVGCKRLLVRFPTLILYINIFAFYFIYFYIGLVLSPNLSIAMVICSHVMCDHVMYDKQGACKFTCGMHIFIFFITNVFFSLLMDIFIYCF
jgi:hypothetical protein